MPTYTCSDCNMSLESINCSCGTELDHTIITKDNGDTVQVAQCPDGHGKIKSPTCCGMDMNPG